MGHAPPAGAHSRAGRGDRGWRAAAARLSTMAGGSDWNWPDRASIDSSSHLALPTARHPPVVARLVDQT